MADFINIFLVAFSGVASFFSEAAFGGYSIGSLIFGAFCIGYVFLVVLRVLRR